VAEVRYDVAKALPSDFDEHAAAYARAPLATHWQRAQDIHKEMETIRGLVIQLDTPGPMDADVGFLMYVRTAVVREHTDRFGQLSTGSPDSLLGALALARLVERPSDLWIPRWREAADRAAELWPRQGPAYTSAHST
jgi:hypothetical protein